MTVVVVGGGVLGGMHALAARERGHEVVHLEREAAPRGASVRNFGLVWVSGRAGGAELALALRARELWEELAGRVGGLGFRAHGSLTVATRADQLVVLEQVSRGSDAAERGLALLSPQDARACNPALGGQMLGALLCGRDAIVEPRRVPAALRDHLLAGGGYTWLPGREAVDYADHAVRDQTEQWHRGDLVVLCPGAQHRGLAGAHLGAAPLRRVRLQMLETAPFPQRLTTSLADGDSLRYYPAFDVPARTDLAPQDPLGAAWHSQLLLVQRLDGSLTVGDTHAYAEPFPFDVEEEPYEHLRAAAQAVLGAPLPPTVRRWAGVYSQVTDASLYHRAEVAPGVVVVTGPGGRGMTCAPAIAEETFA